MVKSSILEIILEKITRVFSLLLAIKVALIYAILNSIISAIITGLYMTTDIKLSFKQDFITLVSFIVSLLISARTSNAYNRYLEGQSLWTKIRLTILNLAGFIRINITDEEQKEHYTNILIYLVITVKDYLLTDSKDMTGNNGVKNNIEEIGEMKKIIENINDYDEDTLRKRLHLIILNLNLFTYEQEKKENEEKDKPSKVNYDKLRDGILTLTECLSGLEKVDRSIPFAYSTLLSVTTWIFSLSLSFQLVADLQWVTVPIVFFSTLFLFGIIELAKEIENPFGIDVHDLDLDKFCEDIWRDTKFIMTDNEKDIKTFCNKELECIKKFKEIKNNETKINI
ncbi:UPF0187-domain-containing protein [Gigaspora margarita]|uniref:UPF0187-domain-containing protein n=1 Tax=Gigaspora margarita TaxID=4874 RepID=A0A8H4B4Z6_GIGMA|nr:UPF0187-domain-containing protein [Gigaspora margarita]